MQLTGLSPAHRVLQPLFPPTSSHSYQREEVLFAHRPAPTSGAVFAGVYHFCVNEEMSRQFPLWCLVLALSKCALLRSPTHPSCDLGRQSLVSPDSQPRNGGINRCAVLPIPIFLSSAQPQPFRAQPLPCVYRFCVTEEMSPVSTAFSLVLALSKCALLRSPTHPS